MPTAAAAAAASDQLNFRMNWRHAENSGAPFSYWLPPSVRPRASVVRVPRSSQVLIWATCSCRNNAEGRGRRRKRKGYSSRGRNGKTASKRLTDRNRKKMYGVGMNLNAIFGRGGAHSAASKRRFLLIVGCGRVSPRWRRHGSRSLSVQHSRWRRSNKADTDRQDVKNFRNTFLGSRSLRNQRDDFAKSHETRSNKSES